MRPPAAPLIDRIDLSVLEPCTADQLLRYIAFLRDHGDPVIAAAVETKARTQGYLEAR